MPVKHFPSIGKPILSEIQKCSRTRILDVPNMFQEPGQRNWQQVCLLFIQDKHTPLTPKSKKDLPCSSAQHQVCFWSAAKAWESLDKMYVQTWISLSKSASSWTINHPWCKRDGLAEIKIWGLVCHGAAWEPFSPLESQYCSPEVGTNTPLSSLIFLYLIKAACL